MKQIIAMHGWSSDSHSWCEWEKAFEYTDWIWQSPERGYGDTEPIQPSWEKTSFSVNGYRRVVIGHSLGPHLLPKEIFEKATDVVFLNSFSQFLAGGDKDRSSKVALSRMQNLIGTQEEKQMLNSFFIKAIRPSLQKPKPPQPIAKGLSLEGRQLLSADLDLLIKTSTLPRGIPVNANVLVINGEDDSIVSASARISLIKDLKRHLKKQPEYLQLPGLGHWTFNPELISLVMGWLEK